MMIKNNGEFLFGFEAVMSNPNGDPDQENKPRMDYETGTNLVSDARRKRDVRDFLKLKGYQIFVDTLNDKKVGMPTMFEEIRKKWMEPEKLKEVFAQRPEIQKIWKEIAGNEHDPEKAYQAAAKDRKKKDLFTTFNNLFLTHIITESLIDIRLFGSAMAIEGVTRTYTGPVQINWGYSLHPVELVKSNSITTIMNDDSSTFGKKNKLYYSLVAHYGTINKFNAEKTGMREEDLELFRKALIQGMMNQLTDSKQGQSPLFYLEVVYQENFDGYLGDLRRFIRANYDENKPIRSLKDLKVDFSALQDVLKELQSNGRIKKVIKWINPYVDQEQFLHFPDGETIDMLAPIKE